MIYLRQFNLIFLKSKKTAGTSVEVAVSCNAGVGDIVTPLAFEDEVVRIRAGGMPAQNWAWRSADERYFRQATSDAAAAYPRSDDATGSNADKSVARYFNHMGPHLLQERLGGGAFQSALKISICRHPYEQLVSRAYWRLRTLVKEEAEMALMAKLDELIDQPPPNEGFYWMGGARVCDVVLRYESLISDLTQLEARTGLHLVRHLPKTKHQSRHTRLPARDILSPDQKLRCQASHRREFDLFGYAP